MSTPPPPMLNAVVPEQPVEPGLSEPARIINTYIAPSKTFKDIHRNASWWVPLLLVSIFSIAFFILIDKKVGFDEVARHMMESNSRVQQMPPDQQERVISFTATSMKYGGFASPIFVLFYAFVIAGVLWLTFNFTMDAQIPFSRAMAIVLYGWLPAIIGTALAMVTLGLGNPEGFRMENPVGTNPAYFMDYATTSKFVYVFLSAFDVISLWCVALIGIGFALNAKRKISTGTAIGIVAAWFFLYKLGSAALAAARS
jgi:Yip1 domain